MKNNTSLVYSVFLIVGDFAALLVAFVVAYILRVSVSHVPVSEHVHALTYFDILLTVLPFWILIFALLGMYNHRVYDNRFSELGRILVGSFVGILSLISYSYMANIAIFPARLVTVYGFAMTFLVVLFFRTVARGARRQLFTYGIGINNVLIVGDTRITCELTESMRDTAVIGHQVIGVVGGKRHPHKNADFPVFDSFGEAVRKLKGRQLHTIVQTELYAAAEKNDEILTYAQENHISYRFVPGNSELFVGNLEVDLFSSIPVITVHQTALVGWGRIVKRLTDILFGGFLLILASPIILLIALFISVADKGDPLYKQKRLTRFNDVTEVYKFRTQLKAYHRMSPEEGFKKMSRPELAVEYRKNGDFLENDPRVSRLGRFLRRTSLDELPQLLNVVKGDISLVGPRSLEPFELEHYDKKSLILSVKSGLTGLAQISGRRDISFEQRRKLDLYYVQNWSFWNDIVIVVKTAWIVLFRKGAF